MTNLLPLPKFHAKDYPRDPEPHLIDLKIEFTHWLTILSGANGTGKSTILRLIKSQHPQNSIIYNPKRSAIKKGIKAFLEEHVRNQKTKQKLIDEKLGKQFDDNNSEVYNSFSDIIVADFIERRDSDIGKVKNSSEIINDLKKEYSGIVKKIFPDYKLSNWDYKEGSPYFQISKYQKYDFESDQLSTGEQEILSLVFNIYFLKDS